MLWDAIDLEAGTLTVRWALQRQTGKGMVLVPPKSKAGRRTIKLPDPLRDALRQHRAQQAEQRLAAGSVWEDGGFVFCQPNGRPLDARRDWKAWKDLLRSAGVRDARLHDARHRRDPAAATGSARPGRDADPGSLPDPAHLGHLLTRRTGVGAGSSGPDGRRAMELTGTRSWG